MTKSVRSLVTSASARVVMKIYSYENQVLAGTIFHPYGNRIFYFRDVVELMSVLEQIYDQLSFPQAANTYRSFRPTVKKRSKRLSQLKTGGDFMNPVPPELEKSKEKASFLVHVQFRQHATWQGTITWVNKGVTQQFRSVLEMIRLMTEAVESDNPERSGFPLPMEAEKPEDSPAGEKD